MSAADRLVEALSTVIYGTVRDAVRAGVEGALRDAARREPEAVVTAPGADEIASAQRVALAIRTEMQDALRALREHTDTDTDTDEEPS